MRSGAMKAALGVLLFCAGLFILGTNPEYGVIKGARAQFGCGIGAPGPFTGCGSSGPCSQYTTFIGRTSGTSATEQSAYKAMICGMVTDGTITGTMAGSTVGATGCGSVIDILYIFATNTTTTADLNLCSTGFGITVHGSPTFSADNGYTGTALATDFLDTGFIPSSAGGNYALNSASFGAYVLTSRTSPGNDTEMGAGDSNFAYFKPLNSSSAFESDVNAANFPSASNSNTQGQWVLSRTGSANFAIYKNNSAASFSPFTSTSNAVPAKSFFVLALNNNGSAAANTPDQISAVVVGGGLNSTQASNISSRINGYMTALGINVY